MTILEVTAGVFSEGNTLRINDDYLYVTKADDTTITVNNYPSGTPLGSSFVMPRVYNKLRSGDLFMQDITCPYCDTADIFPIKSTIPGAPDVCPKCGGWL